jgi:hypothetical protein
MSSEISLEISLHQFSLTISKIQPLAKVSAQNPSHARDAFQPIIFKTPKNATTHPLRPILGNSNKGKELSFYIQGQIIALSNIDLGQHTIS